MYADYSTAISICFVLCVSNVTFLSYSVVYSVKRDRVFAVNRASHAVVFRKWILKAAFSFYLS